MVFRLRVRKKQRSAAVAVLSVTRLVGIINCIGDAGRRIEVRWLKHSQGHSVRSLLPVTRKSIRSGGSQAYHDSHSKSESPNDCSSAPTKASDCCFFGALYGPGLPHGLIRRPPYMSTNYSNLAVFIVKFVSPKNTDFFCSVFHFYLESWGTVVLVEVVFHDV